MSGISDVENNGNLLFCQKPTKTIENVDALETGGSGHPRPQKQQRPLWSAEDLKCPNYNLNPRYRYWKSASYALKEFFTPKGFQ